MWPLHNGRFFGLQIAVVGYPEVPPSEIFDRVVAVAIAAEEAGFSTVTVMDHMHHPLGMGQVEDPVLEAYTLLGAIAARTSRAWLGTLVASVSYRNPAMLAKQVTTLDVISRGRALLGLGAGWYEEEFEAYGVDLATLAVRRQRVREAVEICRSMFAGERPVLHGQEYRVNAPLNHPAPIQGAGLPILLGSSGGPRMIRLIAQLADVANLTSGFDDLPAHLELLNSTPRSRGALLTSGFATLMVGDTHAEALRKRDDFIRRAGLPDWTDFGDAGQFHDRLAQRWIVGDDEEVLRQLKAVYAMGVDGVIVDLRADGLDVEAVKRAGRLLVEASS
ncbi:MAG TPA: LLM class flavin-dependent oxidoreductase [Galbitalea sp.]|jgi:alkanesulfonate monooxygenase SsuD/methylene tetrahydromethanopterin reductase-like flavin-dependent oxidoreductase (luciferase family)